MGSLRLLHLVFLVIVLETFQCIFISAVHFSFMNTAKQNEDSKPLYSMINEDFTISRMEYAATRIWSLLDQPKFPRKDVVKITLFIDDMKDVSTHRINGRIGEIHISAKHITSFSTESVTQAFTYLLYCELAHIFQWTGKGRSPKELEDGIAAFIVSKLDVPEPSNWVKLGEGNAWNESPDVTARFLAYCTHLKPSFIAELNKKMITSYSEDYFVQLLGHSIEQLWTAYKVEYKNKVV